MARFNDSRLNHNQVPLKDNMKKKSQLEIDGIDLKLEEALDDLIERLDELDKIKDSITPAKERLANIMYENRREKIYHKGRHFSIASPEIKPKLRVTKQKGV